MEELIFRTKVETGKSVSDVDNLNSSLAEVGDSAKSAGEKGSESLALLNKKVAEGNLTMKEATKAVKEYATIALNAGRDSPVGQEVIRLAGELSDTLGDLRAEITNAGTDGANLKASLELGSAVTAGYGAFQGVLAMTGVENEALAQTFVKLQAVQSVLTGIEQIRASLEKESLLVTKAKVVWSKVATAAEYVYAAAVGTTTGAMKALRIAMLSIPIIAIIAGIVALIAALASFMGTEEKAEEQNKALNASFEKQNEALEANSRAYKRNSDNKRALMVSENASAEQLFEFDKKRLFDEEVLRKKNVKLLKDMLPQKTAAYRQALREENFDLAKTIAEETKQMRSKYKSFKELDGQYAVDRKVMENNFRNDIAKKAEEEQKAEEQKNKENAKKAADRRASEAQKRLEQQRLLEDVLIANLGDANVKRIAQLKIQHERELSETKKKYGANSTLIVEMEKKQATEKKALLDEISLAEQENSRRSSKALLEGKILQMQGDFQAEQALKREQALADMNESLSRQDLTEGEKFKIKQEYTKKISDLDVEQASLEKKNQKALLEGKLLEEQRNQKILLEGKLLQTAKDYEAEQEIKKELAQFEMDEALAQQNLTEGEKFKIRQEYINKIDALAQEQADREKKRQKDIQDAAKTVLQTGLDSAQGLADAFFDYKIAKAKKGSSEELALEKKKFEINKKLQVAQAVMQGIQATMAAYSSGSAIPIVGTVTGPAFAAIAAVTAALNVAKIKNTSFQSSSASTSTPSASAPSVSVPEVQGQNTATTTETQGLQGMQAPATTKVVLVDSELKASMGDNQQVSIVSNIG